MKKNSGLEPDWSRSDSSPHVAWLDPDDSPAQTAKDGVLRRMVAFLVGIWLLARMLIIYVGVPCAFVVALIVLVLVLRLPPLIGGLLFALGIGFGVGFYFDEIVR